MKESANINEVVGCLIKDERINKGWSQKKLADAVDLKRTSISNIESGRQSLSVEQFVIITHVLEEDPAHLLGRAMQCSLQVGHDDLEQVVAKVADNDIIQKHILKTLKR